VSIYSLPLLKVLERGLLKEIDQIYEVLRDLLMTWEFIDANSPMIMVRPEDVTDRQSRYEGCEAWLRQIVAFRQVITQEVRIESIQNEESAEKFETANVVQLISSKADRPSYLTYLMVKNYQRSLSR
jgi:formate-dependent nitrite reductase cytochrome c552 subunit